MTPCRSGTTSMPLPPLCNTNAVSGRTPRRPARAPIHRIRNLNNKNPKFTTYLVPRLSRSPEPDICPHSDPPPSPSSLRCPLPSIAPSRQMVGHRSHPCTDPMLQNRGHLDHHTVPPGLRTGRPRLDDTDGHYPIGCPYHLDTVLIALLTAPAVGSVSSLVPSSTTTIGSVTVVVTATASATGVAAVAVVVAAAVATPSPPSSSSSLLTI